ncbi:deoxynucleotide monophosphate kinase family protein [Cytobacillus gottheilii]|uniref:deoxynucleotide monophosphate kinase family protein n=1 Tax=Cytobacillus gottheilii TaxID=859144 RepID=UPI0021496596|nr:AAA family ATPase [Cytobacillus gottheilii]
MNIALVAKMRSGKDTLADYVIKKYGYTRFAFGDGIREVARELFPEQMKDGNKPRALLQGIGQSMRKFDNDVWVNRCFTEIKKSEKDRIIITDLRQPNEFARVKEEGYITIKIVCDDEIRINRILESNDNFNKADLYHETEMHIDTYDCDHVIYNNDSLESLFDQFNKVMRVI